MATATTRASVSLEEACADKRLIGVRLHPRQKELLQVVDRNPTTLGLAGRQGGKTLCAACFLTHNMLLRPDLDQVAGRNARWVVSIANSREQAGLLLGYVKAIVTGSPLLKGQIESMRDERITFKGNRVLVAAPCQDRLIRGVSASAIVFDEASHFVSESWGPRTLERIWQAARPLLTVYGEEGRTLGISTPSDGDDFFGRLFTQAEQGALPGAVAFRATTKELNPAVSDAFLESERLMLGEGPFRREYMAEFTPGAAGAFLEEDAVKAVVGRYHELNPDQGTGWLVAFDPSFSVDPSAAIVIGREPEDRKRLVVAHAERWTRKASRSERRRAKTEQERLDVAGVVLDAVARLSLRFGNCAVITDQHSRRLVESGLRERGVNVVRHRSWTSSTQTEAFRMLRARIYGDTISLPVNDQLVRELCRVRERTRGGKSEVDLPRSVDGHLDLAVALALGAWESDVRGASQPMHAGQGWKRRVREDARRELVERNLVFRNDGPGIHPARSSPDSLRYFRR
jgi:Terminase large subunit, T4likevirus-type, N-terminal